MILFLYDTSNSQVINDKYFEQNFIPIYDSLVHSPLNCEEAFKNTSLDTLTNKFELSGKLKDQFELINNLDDEYQTESLKSEQNKFALPEVPDGIEIPGNRPPQNGNNTPGSFGYTPDNVREIMEDMNKANIVMDKITVNTEKYKKGLKKSVSELNEKLKSTLKNYYEGRVKITNEFLSSQNTEYDKYFTLFRINIVKIRDIVKKYNYGRYLKFPPLRNDLLRLQASTVSNLKFLITITKEFSLTGAKFYNEEINNRQ